MKSPEKGLVSVGREPVADDSALVLAEMSKTLGQNPVAIYLARLAKGSRPTQTDALKQIVRWLGGGDPNTFAWHRLRYEHTSAIRTLIVEQPLNETGIPRKPATVNRYLAALRGVLKETWRLGLMDTDSYMRARDIHDVKDQTVPTGRELSREETDALVEACVKDDTPYGVRDVSMLTLLSYGLRRFEVIGARLENFNPTTGELQIIGKGKKLRKVFINERHRRVLATWFAVRPAGDFIISSPHNGDQMTTQTVYDVLKKRAGQAGLTVSFAAHDFRRTFASRLLAKIGDLATVQRLLGHSDPKTTARYDRRGDAALKKATEDM